MLSYSLLLLQLQLLFLILTPYFLIFFLIESTPLKSINIPILSPQMPSWVVWSWSSWLNFLNNSSYYKSFYFCTASFRFRLPIFIDNMFLTFCSQLFQFCLHQNIERNIKIFLKWLHVITWAREFCYSEIEKKIWLGFILMEFYNKNV